MAIISSMATRNTGCLSRAAAVAVLALASTSLARPALSQDFDFVAVRKASEISLTTGIRIQGAAPGSLLSGIGGAGDMNFDGILDVGVGSPNADQAVGPDAGAVYVVFGRRDGHAVPFVVSNITAATGIVIKGPSAQDRFGDFAAMGNFNGDSFDDILAGAPGTPFAPTVPGNAFLVPGASNLPSSFTVGPTNSSKFIGVDLDDGTGSSGAAVGDLNRDGFPDFAIAASRGTAGGDAQAGQTFVAMGALIYPPNVALSTIGGGTGGFRADGIDAGDHSGFSVASAGDVNGDGFGDVIIGAYDGDPYGDSNAGESYVIFGNAAIFATNPDLATLDGNNGFRLNGIDEDDLSGVSVASAGDVNGDGFGDLIVGAPNGNPNGKFNAGESYVVFGKGSGFPPAIDLASLDGVTGFRIDGMDFSDFSGSAVASAGDVNGDGFGDILIGAQFAFHDGAFSVGESYVVFGKAVGFAPAVQLSSLDGSNGFRVDGIAEGDRSGQTVAAGDVNGDGFSDIVIGARFADPNGVVDAGEVYVVYGRGPNSARTRVGSAAGQYISGGAFADTLRGLGGNDTLEGRGGADSLIGGANIDTASYAHAAAAVKANLATPASNTGDAAGDTYASIENLSGSRFADTLTGNSLANRLTGGPGADGLTGGGGSDIFTYTNVGDSPVGTGRDRITDFNAGDAGTRVDLIDLSAIDAQTGPGNQAFKFGPFNGTKGRLRARLAGTSTIIEGDVNGDNAADFQIVLLNFTNLANLTSIDFIR